MGSPSLGPTHAARGSAMGGTNWRTYGRGRRRYRGPCQGDAVVVPPSHHATTIELPGGPHTLEGAGLLVQFS